MSLVIQLQGVLYNRLRSKVPIDTGNMLAHIEMGQIDQRTVKISISAPMNARIGMISKKTKQVVQGKESDYDYARHVNYSSKSPHKFWVEHQIYEAVNIMRSNQKYGLYGGNTEWI